MKKLVYFSLVLMIALGSGVPAIAAAPQWDVDPAHSGFYFSVNHIYSKVKGFFSDYSGTIYFDPADLKTSRFDFMVKVKSVDTQNSKRDGHLLSDEFFHSKKFPAMTFKSNSITHIKENQYTVNGVLTIKDVSTDVTVPFTFFGTKTHPFNPKQMVAGFEARLVIDRLAYHVGNGKFLKMGVVGKEVTILITLEATRNT